MHITRGREREREEEQDNESSLSGTMALAPPTSHLSLRLDYLRASACSASAIMFRFAHWFICSSDLR